MQSLTLNEIAILKSRLQVGDQGHSQQVKLTAYQLANGTLRYPYYPDVVLLPTGNPGLLFNAQVSPYGSGDYHTIFQRYATEHVLAPYQQIFSYNTPVISMAVYKGTQTIAVAWDGTHLRARISLDSGATWGSEFNITGASYASGLVTARSGSGMLLRTSRDGNTIYLFYIRVTGGVGTGAEFHIVYRSCTGDVTVDANWSAEQDTGCYLTDTRNYGGASARNQQDTRAFQICQAADGSWLIAGEIEDGDWHANHGVLRSPTLSGSYTITLHAGYGGGLTGGQGATGGIFLDRTGQPWAYFMSDNGDYVTLWKSTDHGVTWGAGTYLLNGTPSPGLGAGQALYVPGYTQSEYIWGSQAGNNDSTFPPCRRYIGVLSIMYAPGKFDSLIGEGAPNGNVGSVVTTDISDRVRSISTDKSLDLDSDTFSLVLHNEDRFLNIHNQDGSDNQWVQPDTMVEIWQWHGVVANKVKTFTGYLDHTVEQAEGTQTVTMNGRDANKKLITQEIVCIGSQDITSATYIGTMANGVYINKTVNEVLTDLICSWASQPSTALELCESSFVFSLLIFGDGEKIIDCVKRACDLAGLRFWATEDGHYKTEPLSGGPAKTSVWTYAAKEDITTLRPEISDDATRTRVMVIGKSNIGAIFLQEQISVDGRGAPAGIEYDPPTGDLWYIDQSGRLSLLDPANSFAEVRGIDGIAVYPDGLAIDPIDNNLWVVDFSDPTYGASFRKIDRTTYATLAGPYANPDADHCSITGWPPDGSVLFMTTLSTGQLVKMNRNTGAEIERHTPSLDPVPSPFTPSGVTAVRGGLYICFIGTKDVYQTDIIGQQAAKITGQFDDPNELSWQETTFGAGLWVAYQKENRIAKYVVVDGTGDTATVATAIDATMEGRLGGEKRISRIRDMAVDDPGMAQIVANRNLKKLALFNKRIPVGIVGNPGIQIGDHITINAPGSGITSGDWNIVSNRADQQADNGSYLSVLVVEPVLV